MGSFYTNHTVCAPNLSIIESIEEIRPAFVSKIASGCQVIFDEKSENQDEQQMQDINILLSQKTGGVVFSALIHDDSALLYWLSINGKIVQKYNSMPSLFLVEEPRPPEGGNSSELCAAFGTMNVEQVEQILRADLASEKYVYETDRHKDLVAALNLPKAAVGMSYSYIVSGDFLTGISAEDFIELK